MGYEGDSEALAFVYRRYTSFEQEVRQGVWLCGGEGVLGRLDVGVEKLLWEENFSK